MKSPQDRFWESIAADLRDYMGLRPLTQEEAEEEFRTLCESLDEEPLSEEKIDMIFEFVTKEKPQ